MNYFNKRDEGQILIITIITVLVIFGFIVGSIYNTKISQKLSADFRGSKTLEYKAMDCLNRAISQMVKVPPTSLSSSSPMYFTPYSGRVACRMGADNEPEAFHVDTGDACSSNECGHIKCSFYVDTHSEGSNIITAKASNQKCTVTAIRKPDYCEDPSSQEIPALGGRNHTCGTDNTPQSQVYLLNSIAYDNTGRSYMIQGVVGAPLYKRVKLNKTTNSLETEITADPFKSPYLMASSRGGEHTIIAAKESQSMEEIIGINPTFAPPAPTASMTPFPDDPTTIPYSSTFLPSQSTTTIVDLYSTTQLSSSTSALSSSSSTSALSSSSTQLSSSSTTMQSSSSSSTTMVGYTTTIATTTRDKIPILPGAGS